MFPQFYEMDMWIYARLCQNPDAEVSGLIADFLNGYYGAAGPALRKYVEEIHSRLPRFQYRFFDYTFMDAAQKLFDQAEAAVKNDTERLGRVRDLRLQLDLAALVWRSTIIRDYLAKGGKLETYPYRTAFLKARSARYAEDHQAPLFVGQRAPLRRQGPQGLGAGDRYRSALRGGDERGGRIRAATQGVRFPASRPRHRFHGAVDRAPQFPYCRSGSRCGARPGGNGAVPDQRE